MTHLQGDSSALQQHRALLARVTAQPGRAQGARLWLCLGYRPHVGTSPPGRQLVGKEESRGEGGVQHQVMGAHLFPRHLKDKASSRAEAPCEGSGSTDRCGTSLPFLFLFPKVPGSSCSSFPGHIFSRDSVEINFWPVHSLLSRSGS